MTVAVLNLNKAVDRWGERAVLVARELAHLQPDVIGFQEVDLRIDQGNWLCHRVNALREFHTKALYTIHHMANPRDNVTIEALAIMTQLPMVEHEGLDYLIRNRVAHRARLTLPEGSRLWPAPQLGRVCQAWHRTSEVQVLVPGIRGAEGEEQGKGAHREVGSGGSPIQTRGTFGV